MAGNFAGARADAANDQMLFLGAASGPTPRPLIMGISWDRPGLPGALARIMSISWGLVGSSKHARVSPAPSMARRVFGGWGGGGGWGCVGGGGGGGVG